MALVPKRYCVALSFIALCTGCIPEIIILRKSAYYEKATEEDSTTKTAAKGSQVTAHVGYTQITSSMAALFGYEKNLLLYCSISRSQRFA